MKVIDTLKDLNDFLESNKMYVHDNCVLAVKDNKSDILIQYVIVENPISFVRNIQEFSNSLKIPISDIDIVLIGFFNCTHEFSACERSIISPYVYFNKPEETKSSGQED